MQKINSEEKDTKISKKKTKHIVLMAGMFHPQYSANGICVKNVADEFVKRGHKVSCICNEYGNEPYDDTIDGINVYRITHRLYDRISQWCACNKENKITPFVIKFNTVFNKLKLLIMSPFWPLVAPLYTYRFYSKAKELYKKEKYDVLVCAYTPIDTALAGSFIKKKYNKVTFIPYYLDALSGGWGPSKWSEEKKERHTRRYEKYIDEAADVIFSMESSKKYHEENPLNVEINKKRMYLDVPLMNKFVCANTQVENKIPRFVFAGASIVPRRDPRPVLDIMLELTKLVDAEIIFAGECNKPEIFDEYVSDSGGKIKYTGKLPHSKILKLEQTADFLINIGSTNASTISGKIFEYMSNLKPIVSSYKIENEPSIEYLEKYGYVLFIDERKSPEENAQLIAEYMRNCERPQLCEEQLRERFYANTPDAFVDAIERIKD